MDISSYIVHNRLNILAKPNAPRTEILEYDAARNVLIVAVHAKPEENKANIELIKFFSRLLKRKVSIQSGLTSRKKVLRIEQTNS